MNTYLYGEKAVLEGLIKGDLGFRFSELAHYAAMENSNMRDNETIKTFSLDHDIYTIKINDISIPSEAFSKRSVIEFPTQYCYCLCFSHRENSSELYEKFSADICIEIKAEALAADLVEFFKEEKGLSGVCVLAKSITYYKDGLFPASINPFNLIFYKHERFSHEREFRIALIFPNNKKSFVGENGEIFPFRNDHDPQHILFSHSNDNKRFVSKYIGKVFVP